MPDEKEVYQQHADRYEALVSREDYQGNILREIRKIAPLSGSDAIDLGAGTGRLACLLAPYVRSLYAFDLSAHMLAEARIKLRADDLSNWQVMVADHRFVPLPTASVDLVVSGWSVSYLAVWNPANGREELDGWMGEMKRILKPDGRVILFESLGTGGDMPQQLPHLEATYHWLEENGFSNSWIRTDYHFETLEQAVDLVGFFFGEELAGRVWEERLTVLPECTGVWWRTLD
jgi:ubiquinone/menaquinone biosynthesis C-methylase UbiE